MADFNKYFPILQKTEAGLSADPRDKSAAKKPSSYVMTTGPFKGYPVHTNRGVTFATFVANASKVGLKPTTSVFINLTYEQAKKFYKLLFWDRFNLDKVGSQGVAEFLAEAGVGSNVGFNAMVRAIQKAMKSLGLKVAYTGRLDAQTINAINSIPPNYTRSKYERFLIDFLTTHRLDFLKGLSNFSVYGNGWTSRVNSTRDRAISYIA